MHTFFKYFLLFERRAIACLGLIFKFLHKDKIINSKTEEQYSYFF